MAGEYERRSAIGNRQSGRIIPMRLVGVDRACGVPALVVRQAHHEGFFPSGEEDPIHLAEGLILSLSKDEVRATAFDCRLPIADCRLPIADCRSHFPLFFCTGRLTQSGDVASGCRGRLATAEAMAARRQGARRKGE
jgi:hypothetical protein